MTASLQTPAPVQATGQAAATGAAVAGPTRFWRRFLLGLGLILLIFLATYALAWFNAYTLSSRFYQDAASSYRAGDFLKALVGYQEFDAKTNKYINFGGYLNVEKIWSNRYSWPAPPYVQESTTRSQEIIQQKLTVAQAEQYVQENTGRPGAPYFAEIYLRLGELYAQSGDTKDAIDVFQSFPSQFPNRPDLIKIAQQSLARLQSQGK